MVPHRDRPCITQSYDRSDVKWTMALRLSCVTRYVTIQVPRLYPNVIHWAQLFARTADYSPPYRSPSDNSPLYRSPSDNSPPYRFITGQFTTVQIYHRTIHHRTDLSPDNSPPYRSPSDNSPPYRFITGQFTTVQITVGQFNTEKPINLGHFTASNRQPSVLTF